MLPPGGGAVTKELVQDLIAIPDPSGLSTEPGCPAPIGLVDPFALP
jgi:hypothetical protein